MTVRKRSGFDNMPRVISPRRVYSAFDGAADPWLHIPNWTCMVMNARAHHVNYLLATAPNLQTARAIFEQHLMGDLLLHLDPYGKIDRSSRVLVGSAGTGPLWARPFGQRRGGIGQLVCMAPSAEAASAYLEERATEMTALRTPIAFLGMEARPIDLDDANHAALLVTLALPLA